VASLIAFLLAAPQSTKAKAGPPQVQGAPLDDEVDEYEDYDPMAGFNSAQKRRVMAMKDAQAKYDDINKEYQKELASLQAKFQGRYGARPLLNGIYATFPWHAWQTHAAMRMHL
jgi:hypothetical protein